MADTFCLISVPDYIQQGCGSEKGGIVALGFIAPSVEIDEDDLSATLENAAWWTGDINTSPSTRHVVLNTRGTKAAGTTVEEDGYGLNLVERTGDDKELTFEALGVIDNRDFWAAMNKRRGWGFVYVTSGQNDDGDYNAFYAPNVSVYADEAIDQPINSRIRWSGSAKWTTDLTPSKPFAFPADVITQLSE